MPDVHAQVVDTGVTLKDPSKVPKSYAVVVESGGKKEIVFGTGGIGYSPLVFNQILSGYSY